MSHALVSILVPLGICVVLPVMIVWLCYRSLSNTENKRAEVLIEAIRANNNIDINALAKSFAKQNKTPREVLNSRLLKGCIWGLIGLVLTLSSIFMMCFDSIDTDSFEFLIICGLVCIAIGASFLIVYFATRKQLPDSDKTESEK